LDAIRCGLPRLNSIGDFATTRMRSSSFPVQREDGKIHKISQGASFVNWFKDYSYGYASADARRSNLIATNDYVTRVATSTLLARNGQPVEGVQFMRSTYDAQNSAKLRLSVTMGRRRSATSCEDRVLPKWLGLEACALSPARETHRKADVSKRSATASIARSPCSIRLSVTGKKGVRVRLDQQQSARRRTLSPETVPMWFGVTERRQFSPLFNN